MAVRKLPPERLRLRDRVLVNGGWWTVVDIHLGDAHGPVYVLVVRHQEFGLDDVDEMVINRLPEVELTVNTDAREDEAIASVDTILSGIGFHQTEGHNATWRDRDGFYVILSTFEPEYFTLLPPSADATLAAGPLDIVLRKYSEVRNGPWLPQWLTQ